MSCGLCDRRGPARNLVLMRDVRVMLRVRALWRFETEMWHPNIYPDGKVCISILHPPGDDPHNESETADLRWRPVLGVETILVSVISLLSDPNDNSPANIDAAVQWRDDFEGFKKQVKRLVRRSVEDF